MTQILDILRVFAEAPEPVTVRHVAAEIGMDLQVCSTRSDHLRRMGYIRKAISTRPYRWEATAKGLARLSGVPIEAAEPERLTLVQKALRARPELQAVWP